MEEYVLRLDVTVDDLAITAGVEVGKAPRDADGDVHPLLPFQHGAARDEEGLVQGAAVHIYVVDAAYNGDLCDEFLLLTLDAAGAGFDALHGDGGFVREIAFEHLAESSGTDLGSEVVGRCDELLVSESGRKVRDRDLIGFVGDGAVASGTTCCELGGFSGSGNSLAASPIDPGEKQSEQDGDAGQEYRDEIAASAGIQLIIEVFHRARISRQAPVLLIAIYPEQDDIASGDKETVIAVWGGEGCADWEALFFAVL
ncbi:hypothetical protein M5K25_012289 [Dendrobium thyrsiflorum]|uniref:Uncharacterized protein n=1 Tax=Dendrobium thyrsiflorum TaxID=117978 RepID=A0ABD0V3M0_DENTH